MKPMIVAAVVGLALTSCSSSDDAPGATGTAATAPPESSTVPTTDAPPPTSERPTTTPPSSAPATSPPPTQPPTTEPALESDAASRRGPYPVGVTTMQITDGPMVEVWYPAVDGTTGTVTYDARDYVPEAVNAILTGDVASTYTIEASRDAGVATPTDAGFPVVAYSHGFSGFRTIASFLTSHLASWGAVVVAPDHPSRDLNSQLGGGVENPSDPIDDLAASVELVASDERFAASTDVGRLVPIGHSAGGSTVIGFAERNSGVAGYVALAAGRRDETPAPDIPSLHLAGRLDDIIPAERSAAAFETAATPTTFWLIDEVGHNGFNDLCTYGGGTGVIGIAEASGLGGLLDAQPQFRRLGEDGCVPPAAPVELAHPIVLHAVTTWVADVAGLDVGLDTSLDAEVAGQYDLEVTAETRR